METPNDNKPTPSPAKKIAWRRVAKWVIGIAASIVLLVALVLCLLVWILTPQKLTPLVEKYASEYLYADVTADRVELTVWSTFPKIRVDVDNLTIISHTLRDLPSAQRDSLPAYADTLLTVECFNGSLNLAKLLTGTIDLRDVEIVHPAINLVQATPTVANYLITPPSEDESSSSEIPDIVINRFSIVGDAPIRYLSVPDSIDVQLTLASSGLTDSNGTIPYNVSISGLTSMATGGQPLLSNLKVGMNGKLKWSADEPDTVTFTDFDVSIDSIKGKVDAELSIAEPLTVNSANISIAQVKVEDLFRYVPDEYQSYLHGLSTNLTVGADIALTAPYVPSVDQMSSAKIDITVPDGHIDYEGYCFERVGTDMTIDVDGHIPDNSVVTVKRLDLAGSGITVKLDGKVTTPMSDPLLDGNFNGEISFKSLPPVLLKQIPAKLSGWLSGATGFRFHVSDIDREKFHRAYMSGDLHLRQFYMTTPDSMAMYVRNADFKLGTNSSVKAVVGRVDSLLTASLKVDTASVLMPDMQVVMSKASIGIGCRNTSSTSDTTIINPIGGNISIARMDYRSFSDSTRMRMRDMECKAVLHRYHGDKRVPQLDMKATARRLSYSMGLTRMSVRNSEFGVTAHVNQRQKLPPMIQARFDSISAAHPDISPDSVIEIMHQHHLAHSTKAQETELIDMAVSSSMERLLRRWDVRGHLKAQNGRMVTPYFPLRNTISDVDVKFSTDSIVFNSFTLHSGDSNMKMKGSVSNIRRALTSHNTVPLKVRFNVNSDTLNINEITRAFFIGASFDEKAAMQNMISENTSDDYVQQQIESSAADSISALLVPTNIDAELNVKAHNVLYSDVCFSHLHGSVNVYNGGINLSNLIAKTDIGTADLTALYSARTKQDISFGFSLGVHDFNIERFTQLMPVVDSLLPLVHDFKGIINAEVAATTEVDSLMNIELPTLNAAIKMSGDSLVLLDSETFKTLSKWLMFKNKQRNMIDHMAVEMAVNNSQLEFYPFYFDIDRYRLGVMGHNDLALNLNYHISVLKSPLPFKFGINITGTADNMKIRLGKARFKENMVSERTAIVETTRINLLKEIESVFKRGVKAARLGPLSMQRPSDITGSDISTDTLSHADSLALAKEGIITMPVDTVAATQPITTNKKSKKNQKKK